MGNATGRRPSGGTGDIPAPAAVHSPPPAAMPMPSVARNTASSPPVQTVVPPGTSNVGPVVGDGPGVKQAGGVPAVTTNNAQQQKKKKIVREKNRFGSVIVKVASLSSNRRTQDRQSIFTITPRGGLFHGTQCNPILVQKALQSSEYAMLPPVEISLGDSRAHKLLVVHANGWHAIPAPETFSRHSGTCVILGDRNNTGLPFPIKLGDCFRLGSVGLVVSDMRTHDGGDDQRLDNKTLQYLKDEALEFEAGDELAALAADEVEEEKVKKKAERAEKGLGSHRNASDKTDKVADDKQGITNGEKFICYMCYETHDTAEDPLVAPCECRGDTRYLHVQCLQKWYHSSVCGPAARVIRTTGNGAPACKICGTAYRTIFKKPDGRVANLLEMETSGPYLSLVVVTRHDTNPDLFNTKFRLNFGRMANAPVEDPNDPMSLNNALIIGRSSSCSMVLDYRTVSTIHAIVFHNEGKFYLQDRRSSNGTMVYLQDPLELPFSHPIRLRMGRSTLTIQAKRNWLSSIREALNNARGGAIQHPTANELMNLLSISSNSSLPTTGATANAQAPGLGSPGTPAMSPNSLATGSSQPISPPIISSNYDRNNPFGFGQPTGGPRGAPMFTPDPQPLQPQQQSQQPPQNTAAGRYDTIPQEMGVYPRSYGMATNSQAMQRQAARQEAVEQQQLQQQAAMSSTLSPPSTVSGINNNNNSNQMTYFDGAGQGVGSQGDEHGGVPPSTTDLACGVLGNGMGGSGTKILEKQPILPIGGSQRQQGQGPTDGVDMSKVGALPKVQHISQGNLATLSAYHSPRTNSNNSSGNGNIVLTDGAIADFEGSGTLIPGYVQYLEPLRTATAHPTGGALTGGSSSRPGSRPGSRPNSAPMDNNREDLSGAPALAAQFSTPHGPSRGDSCSPSSTFNASAQTQQQGVSIKTVATQMENIIARDSSATHSGGSVTHQTSASSTTRMNATTACNSEKACDFDLVSGPVDAAVVDPQRPITKSSSCDASDVVEQAQHGLPTSGSHTSTSTNNLAAATGGTSTSPRYPASTAVGTASPVGVVAPLNSRTSLRGVMGAAAASIVSAVSPSTNSNTPTRGDDITSTTTPADHVAVVRTSLLRASMPTAASAVAVTGARNALIDRRTSSRPGAGGDTEYEGGFEMDGESPSASPRLQLQVRPLADPTEYENEHEHEDDGQGLALTRRVEDEPDLIEGPEGGDRGIAQMGPGQQPQPPQQSPQPPLAAATISPVSNVSVPGSGVVAVAVVGDANVPSPLVPTLSGSGPTMTMHQEM